MELELTVWRIIYSIAVNIAWICRLLSLKCSFKHGIISSYKAK